MNLFEFAKYLPLIQQLLELLGQVVETNKQLVASNTATQESNAQVVAALQNKGDENVG